MVEAHTNDIGTDCKLFMYINQNTAGKIEIIVNGPHEEYEMTVDLASIPYMWTVEHLAEIINQAFI